MTDKGLIRWILMISEGWRSIGWDSIIYFTTIISINPSLYESAEIDGASRMQVICHIVLPMLLAPMSTMFILNLGYFMSAGFDQVLNFSNSAVQSTIDILDTYIYRIGIRNGPVFPGQRRGPVQGRGGNDPGSADARGEQKSHRRRRLVKEGQHQ